MDDAAGAPVNVTMTMSRAILGIVARSVASALEVVTLPQFRVLVLLSRGGQTRVGDLAEQIAAVPSTFSRSVDRMVAGGWVERSMREENRREILLDLTPDGRKLVDSVAERRRREIRAVLDTMSDADQKVVAAAFELFAVAAGEPTVHDLLTLGL